MLTRERDGTQIIITIIILEREEKKKKKKLSISTIKQNTYGGEDHFLLKDNKRKSLLTGENVSVC